MVPRADFDASWREAARLLAGLGHDVDAAFPEAMTDEELRERMSGNICRCGCYHRIVAAVRLAATGI